MNDDTISRKSVIDAVHTATYRFICGAEDGDEMTDADELVLSINKAVCNAIKALPTAPNTHNALSALDCVERQAVINEMKDMYTAAEEWAQGAHDDDTKARAESCMATNVELKLRVEKLPSVQPQRWIPVTEKQPNHELAIVQYNDGDFDLLQFPTAYRWKDIVAWMPLPEPCGK